MRFFTVTFIIVSMFATIINANNLLSKKQSLKPTLRSNRILYITPVEKTVHSVPNTALLNNKGTVISTSNATVRQVGASSHGYGWADNNTRGIDYYGGPDADNPTTMDNYVLVGYRGLWTADDGSAKDMCATEIDVSAGIGSGDDYNWVGSDEGLNADITGPGARYPSVVALDRPFVAFNQYSGSGGGHAFSHPYLVTDWGTYGLNGGSWTSPDFLMDEGWTVPVMDQFGTDIENRLWSGLVAVTKDNAGIYHYVGIYNNWYTPTEQENFNLPYQGDTYIITATSASDYPASDGWNMGYDVGNEPVRLDSSEIWVPVLDMDMNSKGLCVMAGAGHLGPSDPKIDYYYTGTDIVFATSNDYGVTWSAWDSLSFADMGFPVYHHGNDTMNFPADTVLGNWEIDSLADDGTVLDPSEWDTTFVLYTGPTFMGTNFDMDVVVGEDNTIYIAFNMLWGEPMEDRWIPNYTYTGLWLAKKKPGGSWTASRIAYNNGIWVGDEDPFNTIFGNEPDLSLDDQGNIYCGWLDRRHTDLELTRFSKYTDPNDVGGTIYNEYKTDIYAAGSTDDGATWTEPINCTDSPSIDEYEFSLALHSQSYNSGLGKTYFAYSVADTTGQSPSAGPLMSFPQTVWAGEAVFGGPDAIDNSDGTIATNFVLEQNYPNPFNPATTIKYQMPVRGHVNLAVYNALGQKVRELVNATQKAGEHAVTLNAGNLASGIYYYRLNANGKTQIKKMVLMK